MKLLTAAEQRALDKAAADGGLPTRVLMENAGAAVARVVAGLNPRKVVVFCGPGNNGGDGSVAARLLAPAYQVYTSYTSPERLKGDAADARQKWTGPQADRDIPGGPGVVLIDAVFGSGLTRAPEGAEAEAIRAINAARERGAQVVAVDVPSGIDSDTGAVYPVHLAKADITVTFHAPKRGLYLHPGADCAGRIVVEPIGIPEGLDTSTCDLLDEQWAAQFVKPRPRNSHKNDYGHVLVVAGSPGKSGAAAMVCEAALRAGAGLVTLATRAHVSLPPEVMTVPLPGDGPLGQRDLDPLKAALKGKSALAIGPGIERGPETGALIGALLAQAEASVVDADALNALAEQREHVANWVRAAPSPPIFTPHPGEFSRLTGEDTEKVLGDRVDAALRAAQRFGAHIVLKGAHSIVADPEGSSAICAAGNPGMATAGSGDVLTGIIAAVLARRGGVGGTGDRARLGVFLHAFAGDLAAQQLSETALIATDIARVGLPIAFRRFKA